jgi:hypothetical protein
VATLIDGDLEGIGLKFKFSILISRGKKREERIENGFREP